MKKILIIPPQPWYMEAHYEYIIRYLSDEFFMEQAYVPYPPYENFLDRFPETSPLERNPNDYDLLLPVWGRHWGVENNLENGKKTAIVQYEPAEGNWTHACYVGAVTPIAEEADLGINIHSLRFGIDTSLFRPYKMVREDDLLHVGIVGNHSNPRHMMGEVLPALYDLPGVRIMVFPGTWANRGGNVELLGGMEFVRHCVAGDKMWPGLPNIYNRLDVLLRVDTALGYSFPTLEAAACGVPVIATNQGIDHLITGAGGGILLEPPEGGLWSLGDGPGLAQAVKNAVIWMRDHPEERELMGEAGRVEIENRWTWDKHIPAWRQFFRNALKAAA